MKIEQVRVSEVSEVVARTIQELQIRKELGVVVLAVRKHHGEMVFNPPAATAIERGDYLIVMGKHEDHHALEDLLTEPARR